MKKEFWDFFAYYFKNGIKCLFAPMSGDGVDEHCNYSIVFVLLYVLALFSI